MRKGFTLPLTTIAVALLATSAMALGPTISNVPDVYITQNLTTTDVDISTSANMFRYSDALVLWDYVKPGDTTTSDAIYWAYAIKKTTGWTPTGSYLTGSASHYAINGVVASAITGDETAKDAAFCASVNSAASGTVAAAGALTFRNIRLCAEPYPPSGYPAPTADPDAPAGYLDVQEATLFVTDKSTSPSFDRVLLVTLLANTTVQNDMLSGGAKWETEKTWTNYSTSGFGFGTFPTVAPFTGATGTGTVGTTDMTINCNLANQDFYGQVSVDDANVFTVAADKLYRFKATLQSTNATVETNPDIRVFLNGKSTGVGQGQFEFANTGTGVAPSDGGPTTTAAAFSAYLWPCKAGAVKPGVMCYDSSNADGGIITVSNASISSVAQSKLVSGAVKKDLGNGGVDGTFNISSMWSFYGGDFGSAIGYAGGNLTFTSATSSGSLLVEGITGTSAAGQGGLTQWGASNVFTASASKLVVVKATAAASQITAQSPDVRIFLSRGNYAAELFVTPAVGSGLTLTGKDFYAVFEVQNSSMAGDWNVGLQTTTLNPGTAGTVNFSRLTVTEYPVPVE